MVKYNSNSSLKERYLWIKHANDIVRKRLCGIILIMKSFFKRKDLKFFVLRGVFAFSVIAAVSSPNSLNAQSAQDIEDILASFDAQNTSSTTINAAIANIIASSTEMRKEAEINAAAALAEQKKREGVQNTTMLQQIEALRGILPNTVIDSLEKKYQIGPYSPKPASLAVVSPPKTGTSSPFVFLKNLKQGDTEEGVRALQKILNKNTDTQITSTGPGSPGNETDYFGALTKAAVIKFQNKYSADILVPNGLTVGTGFVGLSTRVVLNDVSGGKNVSSSPIVKTQTNIQPKAYFCQPIFTIEHGPELTASENASISCVTANTQASCEKVDIYTKSTNSFVQGDGAPDCRWVMR
jgi:hypothetical protein